MITEDYVSFEIAKLLKDKGFDIPLNYLYNSYGKKCYATSYNWNQTLGDFQDYSCPTLQMTMKWLREAHNIEIAISYGIIFDRNTLKQVFKYFWSIVKVNGLCLEFPMNTPDDVCNKEIEANSYEEAVEAAIKYCLINLI